MSYNTTQYMIEGETLIVRNHRGMEIGTLRVKPSVLGGMFAKLEVGEQWINVAHRTRETTIQSALQAGESRWPGSSLDATDASNRIYRANANDHDARHIGAFGTR